MRSNDPVPPMPMASHLVQVIFDTIQQPFERHYDTEGQQFLLWALLHPLPDGTRPATLGAVSRRLQDRDALKREIRAITDRTGAAYHRLGMRVQYSSRNYRLFDVMVGMVAQAVADYITLPAVRTYTATIQLDREQQEALGYTVSYYHDCEQQFLSDCLRSGIAHAQECMRMKLDSIAAEADAEHAKRIAGGGLSEALDDDIPF